MTDQQESTDVAESQPVAEELNPGEAEVTDAAPAVDASELKEDEIGGQTTEEKKDQPPPAENNESPVQDVPIEGALPANADAEQNEMPGVQEANQAEAEQEQPNADKPDSESMPAKTEVSKDGQVTEEADAPIESEVEGVTEEAAEGADKPRDDGEEGAPMVEPVVHEEAEPLIIESEMPERGTPEKQESDAEELLLVEEEEAPQYNRDELLQQYQAAMQEREQLTQHNRNLQHKLSEYFRKKKTEEVRQEIEKNTADQEQRYMKYMSNLEELRQQLEAEQEDYKEQLEEMKLRKAEKEAKVEEEWEKATEFKRNVALASINSRTGRPIPSKDIEMYELSAKKKEQEVSQVRLEFIKLKNRLKKQEAQLKQKEELAEGLHLIDFEQLKIENQTYNEKIEERNEELLKLRKKITITVQVLTHLKEKLQFVHAENGVKREELAIVEREVAQKRDILSRSKQARDSLRHENNKFQQKCGLLGNSDLLRDFEDSTDEAADLEHRLDLLKRTHAELTLSLNGIKKKIELAKDNQS